MLRNPCINSLGECETHGTRVSKQTHSPWQPSDLRSTTLSKSYSDSMSLTSQASPSSKHPYTHTHLHTHIHISYCSSYTQLPRIPGLCYVKSPPHLCLKGFPSLPDLADSSPSSTLQQHGLHKAFLDFRPAADHSE